MNKTDEEKTEYLFPTRAYEAWEAALKRKFKKIVEGSAMPEILWGIATDGNHASAESDLDTFVQYVKGKREQHNDQYTSLFKSSFLLLNLSGVIGFLPEIKIKWNELSSVSEKTKAEIFKSFSEGISALINSAGITKEQLHKLWVTLYPEATERDFDDFNLGIAEMARHKQYKDAGLEEAADVIGGVDEEDGINSDEE